MKIIKDKNRFNYNDIYLKDDNKTLNIVFAGVHDLFWILSNNKGMEDNDLESSTFYITKKDTELYNIFNELINQVKLQDEYNELYDKEEDTITWISDSTAKEVANEVTIKTIYDVIILEFKRKPYIEGYEPEFKNLYSISIRFRNSGSRYDPLNLLFMNMYKKLQNIETKENKLTLRKKEK